MQHKEDTGWEAFARLTDVVEACHGTIWSDALARLKEVLEAS
ncbi:MAG: hypothetical protein Q7J79_03380 [Gemmatimonadales bacterium]|nr:hypothetical protein [Gemmatimonadales bacterium]